MAFKPADILRDCPIEEVTLGYLQHEGRAFPAIPFECTYMLGSKLGFEVMPQALERGEMPVDDRRLAGNSPLAQSMCKAGQLRPVWLLGKKTEGYRIVSGFRRYECAKALQWDAITAQILPPDTPPLHAALLAILDNRFTNWNIVREADAVKLLKRFAPDEPTLKECLQICNLPYNPKHFEKLAKLTGLSEGLKSYVEEDVISLAVACELADMDCDTAGTLGQIFYLGKLGLNRQREFMRLTCELGKLGDVTPKQALLKVAAQIGLGDDNAWQVNADVKQQTLKLLEALYENRYPNISQVRKQAKDKIAALGLDNRLRLNMPENFENLRHSLSFGFESKAELLELLSLLQNLTQDNGLEKLFIREA